MAEQPTRNPPRNITVIQREDGVEVRKPDGTTQMVAYPERFDKSAFRNVLAAYGTAYRKIGRQPSMDEVHAEWPRVHKNTVGEIMTTPEFRYALQLRGIEVEHPGLSSAQHAALMLFTNPFDKRPVSKKLGDLGISASTWQMWMRYAPFANALEQASRQVYKDVSPMVRTRLAGMAESGNLAAMDRLLEEIGEGPKSRELANAREVVMAMVQAVQKHTQGHPEIRRAIMEDMQLTMMTLQPTGPAEIAG